MVARSLHESEKQNSPHVENWRTDFRTQWPALPVGNSGAGSVVGYNYMDMGYINTNGA